jgi:Pyridoxamine 5'-phosphate oxidase
MVAAINLDKLSECLTARSRLMEVMALFAGKRHRPSPIIHFRSVSRETFRSCLVMSSTEPATRQHAFTGPVLPQLPEPTLAERVRTLMSLVPFGTLSTLSRKHPGFPFGSLMPFALDSSGRPIFLISHMAMHTQNLKTDSRCSLVVGQAGVDPHRQCRTCT